jgi:exodeoxyribonuclease-3
MKVITWNVNGIRARQAQLQELLDREQPDVLCLQEIKASVEQLPLWLLDLEGYWSHWHGGPGYSGVGMHVRRSFCPDHPGFAHPDFDFEHRIATAHVPGATVASVYVPNGGRDFAAKMRFLEALDGLAAGSQAAGTRLVLCGDLNVTRSDRDVHPKERRPGVVGQRPDERALVERLLGRGLVDVHRALDMDSEEIFTWWAPWRRMRERNIGWRIDYVLASEALAAKASSCRSLREFGTSDHAPVVAVFDGD